MALTDSIRDALAPGTVDELIHSPENNYTTILVLRELKSHAVFTTNGQDADIATVYLATEDDGIEYSPGLMFMRKQTGSDRRMGKAVQRDLVDIEDTMDVNKMNPHSPESALYGSAASESSDVAVSVTSRVMYDTAYTVRDASAVIDEKFQNAPGDEYAKGATSAIREPDFFEPGALFPCVITLRDATPEEVAFVLGITLRNKRYGATTTRLGRIKNHVLDIHVGSEEGPANLELAQALVREFARQEGGLEQAVHAGALDTTVAKNALRTAFQDIVTTESLSLNRVANETVAGLKAVATDDNELAELLETHATRTEAYIEDAG